MRPVQRVYPSQLIPPSIVNPSAHRTYDHQLWSFIPAEHVLLLYIAFEERELVRRAAINPDPGRLPYDHSYKHFPECAEFAAIFSETILPFMTHDGGIFIVRAPPSSVPVRELIANVNIIVHKAPAFADAIPEPKTQVSCLSMLHVTMF